MAASNQSKSLKNKKAIWAVFVVLAVGLLAGFFIWPPLWDKPVGWLNQQAGTEILPPFFNRPFHLGLDLLGGTHLVYQTDLTKVDEAGASDAASGVVEVIRRRIDALGVTEPTIQKTRDNSRVIVE